MVQSNTEEVQSATPVHWRASHIEGKAGDRCVHEDTEVVTKISAGHTKSPHAGENQNRANSEQDTTNDGLVHRGIEGLVCQGKLINMVTENSEREDGKGEEVAAIACASKDAGQEVVTVFCNG